MQTDDIKPKVLYIDDEEDNLLVFKSSFRRNYNVITASSAMEARELLNDSPVEIIISDQRMPGITGVEFLTSLPDEPENIRMLLTGYSDMDAVIDAFNTGKIYRYITKPWDKEQLQPLIDGALEKLNKLRAKKLQVDNAIKERKVFDYNFRKEEGKTEAGSLRLELINKDEEIAQLKKQVDESNQNVHLLSELGQEIITNLTIESIVESTYENVNALMDANSFGIGIFNPEAQRIEFNGWIEKGAKLPFHCAYLNEESRPAVRCFKNREEVIIHDFQMAAMAGDVPKSIMYLPLITNDTPIGVISTQSFKKNAYTNYHLNILRNIAIYVATALENAKAYSLIETQKAEIEQKNFELEQKVQQRTEQLQQKNDELESTYGNVNLLSEIGQQITSTLSLEKIIEIVYENVNNMMDATIFGIGVYNPEEQRIEFHVSMEKGVKLPFAYFSLDEENRLATWCFKNQKEAIINDYQTEYNKYIKTIQKTKVGEQAESLLYLPLMTNEGPIGVITVQSFKKHIYNQYHIDILRSLGSYITIAIQNSTSYRQMTHAFEELKAAQTKLVESEKMASLGVLTAGVAHEINNPVNFITAGITSLRQNYKDMETLLLMYLKYDPAISAPGVWEEIQKMRQELSPDELLPEIEKLLTSINNGATRTAQIVKGLQNFTRLDENDMKKANIEESIDNTLVILNNRMKNRIAIIKEYGNIPEIVCYPGQLNQVFMNLLHNASDAIEGEGEIHIKTAQENGHVMISVRDNGNGMPEEIRHKIFEPFFTTKPVGKGTGLGLSIAYGIIEKHKGSIEVKSEMGKGTEFTLKLPMR
jgi:signal transduction histidine kinase/CheY-like chemotaxis protein